MNNLKMPEGKDIYFQDKEVMVFNQLARKFPMDRWSQDEFYAWLEHEKAIIVDKVPGAKIVEKADARNNPPLNTAIYYDTLGRDILPTSALLRTSCNKITHAFCAFKMAEDDRSVRKDHRYVFEGEQKTTIQQGPDSAEAVAVVQKLMRRTDIEHPGTFLNKAYGIDPTELSPSIRLDSLRYGFFVWLDKKDALRCSIDRYDVCDLRVSPDQRKVLPVAEIELAIYPRISQQIADDPRVVELVESLSDSIISRFDTSITFDIKYQRSAQALRISY